MPVDRIGILTAVYPAVWGVAELATGALSDRWGRKHLITAGMLTQAAALALIASGEHVHLVAGRLRAARYGHSHGLPHPAGRRRRRRPPLWRARAVGVYRLWRDGGFAAGASSAASPPTYGGCAPRSGPPPPSPSPPASPSRLRMYETRPGQHKAPYQ